MHNSITLGLLHNIAILLAFSMLYINFWTRSDARPGLKEKLISGLIIGSVGIVLMLTPWRMIPGIVFDTRSILLSISGLFFGLIPTVVAMVITSAFRIYLGGSGVYMGVAVILSAGSVGMFWHYFRPYWQSGHYLRELLFLGLITHGIMALLITLLPAAAILETFMRMIVPLLIIYPAGTILLGVLMIGATRNIQTRKALKEKEQSYKRLYESMKDAYAMVNMEGRIIEFNPSFREMLGYNTEELLLKTYHEITPERWHGVEDRRVALEVLPNGSSSAYEKELIRKDGSLLPVEVKTFALKNDDGNTTAIWAIVRDISGRKKAERDLIRAKEQAEENNRRKSLFLADVSHEIRTPLNAMLGFSVILAREPLDTEQREQYLQIINHSGHRLIRIIDDIVDISRLESRQLGINVTDGLLSEMVDSCLEAFRHSELMKRRPEVTLMLDFPEELRDLRIRTDFFRTQQILDNLISNALKFTCDGRVEVRVRLQLNGTVAHVLFEVEDTGPGIPQEKQQAIFERYRQLEGGESREGMGLGLSISKGLVELLGGRIWCRSVPGEGSCFSFTIPAAGVGRASLASLTKSSTDRILEGKMVVVADEDVFSFLYLRELIVRLGGSVNHARSQQELLSILSLQQPDLIFLDTDMVGNEIKECLHKRKTDGKRIRMIAQTPYITPDERERCLQAGCDGYLAKPIDRNDLLILLREMYGF
ncbi:MAG: PAS domain S-box protein [Bacteroidales bacterium]|nr:PAS domain S-box protein [Bacteroidales bacterium]